MTAKNLDIPTKTEKKLVFIPEITYDRENK